jgi:hypothetical protein
VRETLAALMTSRAACTKASRMYEAASAHATPAPAPEVIGDAEGFDLRPDPLTAQTPAELVCCLQQYRQWAGSPSLRTIVTQSGQMIGTSTLCNLLRSGTLPSLTAIMAVIIGCGGSEEDQKRFATAWRQISSSLTGSQPARPPAPGLHMVPPITKAG